MDQLKLALFRDGDILDLKSLVSLLKQPPDSDRVSQYLSKQLSPETSHLLLHYGNGANRDLVAALLYDLNRIIQMKHLYDGHRFADVTLSPATAKLLSEHPQGTDVIKLNRLLITDAYNSEIFRKRSEHSWLEEYFESALYNCRFFVLFAVFGSMTAALALFVKGTMEIVQGVRSFIVMPHPFMPSSTDNKAIILAFIPAIDNYLFATVLLIFSMAIYELFVSKIDPSWRGPTSRPNWLDIRGLDDLKTHVGEVVIMILIINFFELSFTLTFDRSLDLLMLGGGILLVSLALYITHQIIAHRGKHVLREEKTESKEE